MSDGRGPVRVSRRELLAAAGTIGTIGAIGGMGTTALLTDVETAAGSMLEAGTLDLELECVSEQCSLDPDGTVHFDFEDLQPGASGSQRLSIRQDGNPAWVWLATTCPASPLESAIDVSLTFDRDCDGTVEFRRHDSLDALLADLATGALLSDRCLVGENAGCLVFDWHFRNESGVERYQGETLSFEVQLFATQCRHASGTDNPFADRECKTGRRSISHVEVWGCTEDAQVCDCEFMGKLELSDAYANQCGDAGYVTDGIAENAIEPGLYDLLEDDGCIDTGYDVAVTSTRTNADGETTALAFSLWTANGEPGPDLCRVIIKSGRDEIVYDEAALAPRSNSTEGELEGALR
ncbi:MAG: hypothetical protein ACOCY7_02195 [Halodesulfurarchaeum sp.]